MNGDNVLSDKFRPAALPPVCLQRGLLVSLFNRMADRRIVYVSAPAGYGKTVSTLLWLKSSGYVPIWLSLDEYDNSLSLFYKQFCIGVLSVQPENKAMANILANQSFMSSPVDHTIRLLCEFIPDDRKYAVVLDDMHLISNEELRKSALLVQKRLPASFVVIVLTRNKVGKEYISITGEERCGLITSENLAFSPQEIQRYFGEHGHSLSEDQVASIYSVTGGWPIGINAMAMTGQTMASGGGNVLADYIKIQLWDQYGKKLQEFLLKTSIADELTPELCEKLTGQANCLDTLQQLHKSNALVAKSSDDSTYRYHHLFIDFLRNMLKHDKSINLVELYRQAAEWYLSRKDYMKAAVFFINFRNHDGITRCLEILRDSKINNNIESMLSFTKKYILGKLPRGFIEENAELTGKCAVACFWGGDSAGFCYYMDILYKNLDTMKKTNPAYIKAIPFLGGLDFRTPFHVYVAGRYEKMPLMGLLGQYEQKKPRVMTLTQNFPLAHRSMRDYSEFAIDTENRIKPHRDVTVPLLGAEYELLDYCVRAGLCYEKNQLDEALAYGLAALEKSDGWAGVEMRLCTQMILMVVYSALGASEKAQCHAEEAKALLERENAQYLYPNLLACVMKMKLNNGDTSLTKEWLEMYFVIEKPDLEFYKIYQHFVTARAYMVLGRTAKAMEYLSKLKRLGDEYRRPLDVAEAATLQAALEWATGSRNQAQETLDEVLTSMQEYDFVSVVAGEGAAVLPILRKLRLKHKNSGHESRLSAQFLNKVTIAAYEQSRRHAGICRNVQPQGAVKLSKRQRLIIELLSDGHKNAEIAQMTGLSINTVKVHCSAAYAKLGVNNAMDAVLKAREMKLIK